LSATGETLFGLLSLVSHLLRDMFKAEWHQLDHTTLCSKPVLNHYFGHHRQCQKMSSVNLREVAVDFELSRPLSWTSIDDEGCCAWLENISKDPRIRRGNLTSLIIVLLLTWKLWISPWLLLMRSQITFRTATMASTTSTLSSRKRQTSVEFKSVVRQDFRHSAPTPKAYSAAFRLSNGA
jgi:hypothetical protein